MFRPNASTKDGSNPARLKMAESFSRKVIADQALEKFLAALAALALPGAAWQSWSHFNEKVLSFLVQDNIF